LAEQSFDELCGEFLRRHLDYCGYDPSADFVTRFLCGISVPLFTKLKARATKGFAALANYPYAQVREWVRGAMVG